VVPLRKVVAMLRAMIEQVTISGCVRVCLSFTEGTTWRFGGTMGVSPQCRGERDARAGREEVGSVPVSWEMSLLVGYRYSYCDLSSELTAEPAQNAEQNLGVTACDQSTDLTEEDKEDWEID
jgi:hypothetical protein